MKTLNEKEFFYMETKTIIEKNLENEDIDIE